MQDAPRPGATITASALKPTPTRHLPDWLAVGMALAAAVAGGVGGYTLGLDDSKANAAAQSASRPVASVTIKPTVTKTLEIAKEAPTVYVTLAGPATRKPVEKSPPVAETADVAGKVYILGKDLKFGTYVTEGGKDCFAYVDENQAVMLARQPGHYEVSMFKGDQTFNFYDCAPFRLVR